METLRVIIVDDHPAYRLGLCASLENDRRLEVIAAVDSANAGVEVADRQPLDVAVINMLARRIVGVSFAFRLHERRPGCAVLGLSASEDPEILALLLRAGACGVVTKVQTCHEIAEAIQVVSDGKRYIPEKSTAAVEAALGAFPISLAVLTQREREVLDLLVHGHTNREICERLFISRRTVETHRQRIFKKLSAHSVAALTRLTAIYAVSA